MQNSILAQHFLAKKKRALCYITSYLKVVGYPIKECNNSHTLYSVKPLHNLLLLLP